MPTEGGKRRLSKKGSKQKGDRYERELAEAFNAHVFGGHEIVRRAALSGGGIVAHTTGGADLTGTPELFVEAKRTELLNIRSALAQAETNIKKTGTTDRAVVITRRNQEATLDSICAMRLRDFLELYAAFLSHHGFDH